MFARMMLTLFVGGAAIAGIGLLDQVASNGNVMWITEEPSTVGRTSGPFVNPNHFAAWLEMLIPARSPTPFRSLRRRATTDRALGRHGTRHGRAAPAGLGRRPRRCTSSASWAPLAAATGLLLMVWSPSRNPLARRHGGVARRACGGGAAGIFSRQRRVATLRECGAGLPVALALALVVAATGSLVAWEVAGSDEPPSAAAEMDVSLATRLAVAAQGAAVVRDHPLFGTGLGSWVHAFRPYRSRRSTAASGITRTTTISSSRPRRASSGACSAIAFALAVARAAIRRRRAPIPRSVPASSGAAHAPPGIREARLAFDAPRLRRPPALGVGWRGARRFSSHSTGRLQPAPAGEHAAADGGPRRLLVLSRPPAAAFAASPACRRRCCALLALVAPGRRFADAALRRRRRLSRSHRATASIAPTSCSPTRAKTMPATDSPGTAPARARLVARRSRDARGTCRRRSAAGPERRSGAAPRARARAVGARAARRARRSATGARRARRRRAPSSRSRCSATRIWSPTPT